MLPLNLIVVNDAKALLGINAFTTIISLFLFQINDLKISMFSYCNYNAIPRKYNNSFTFLRIMYHHNTVGWNVVLRYCQNPFDKFDVEP